MKSIRGVAVLFALFVFPFLRAPQRSSFSTNRSTPLRSLMRIAAKHLQRFPLAADRTR